MGYKLTISSFDKSYPKVINYNGFATLAKQDSSIEVQLVKSKLCLTKEEESLKVIFSCHHVKINQDLNVDR